MSETALATPEFSAAGRPAGRLRRRNWPAIIAWAVVLLILVLLPLYLPPGLLSAGQYVMVGAVGAIGLTLVFGQAGQLSLAHAFFLLVGGTAYSVLAGETTQAGAERIVGFGWPPLLALIGAVVITALFGLAFAPVAGRLKGIYLGIASLALVYIGFYLGRALPALTGGASSGRNPEPFSLFGFPFTNEGDIALFGVPLRQPERLWYLFLVVLVIGYLLAAGAMRGRVGRAWRAVRDHEAAAAAMGVNVLRAKAVAFAVSAAYAGLAGVLLVLWYGLLKPDESEFGNYGLNTSIAFLAMVLIGGLGSIPGAVAGALIVWGSQQILTLFAADLGLGTALSGFSPTVISLYVYGLAVIAVVLFEPGGLAAIGRNTVAALRGRRRSDMDSSGASGRRSAPPGKDGK
ncbi:branched-chain amino acid ABC transporter permease [Pseudonocardia asaccharolytica]|uniref:Branched-chain amino acid ABC transporter permease n=1 Tax=Pseudonocardia asaccharolytica DSM 44247 = NBRC 16224 TaxID=1123024 RepID=A0A511D7G1_9PSEU|nr:branched-chain amino acid ABC transporter permease [Pseudonocardia asaccharolytica]GEL20702.1 branched-chain amino acid ABC transporter permease [Pseudonocardia asaccharolytica DSM 44247 = NBRC 16224]